MIPFDLILGVRDPGAYILRRSLLPLSVLVATITDLKDFKVGVKMGRNEISLLSVSSP